MGNLCFEAISAEEDSLEEGNDSRRPMGLGADSSLLTTPPLMHKNTSHEQSRTCSLRWEEGEVISSMSCPPLGSPARGWPSSQMVSAMAKT